VNLRRAYGVTTADFVGFLFRVQPLRDELGNIVRWYETNTDIDDLQKLGNAARAT
jgi:hypothetical protein